MSIISLRILFRVKAWLVYVLCKMCNEEDKLLPHARCFIYTINILDSCGSRGRLMSSSVISSSPGDCFL